MPTPGKAQALSTMECWRVVIEEQALLAAAAAKGDKHAFKRLAALYRLFDKARAPSVTALKRWLKPPAKERDAIRVHFVHAWLESAIEHWGTESSFAEEPEVSYKPLIAKLLGMSESALTKRIGEYARGEVDFEGDGATVAAATLMYESTRFPSVRTIFRRLEWYRAGEV